MTGPYHTTPEKPIGDALFRLIYFPVSVSFEKKDLNLTWHRSEIGSDIFIYDKEMAQFDILSAKRYQKHKLYHSGEYYVKKLR